MFDFTEEQLMMRDTIRKISLEKIAPRAVEIDETEEYPKDIEKILRDQGILKLLIPEKYGGLSGDITTACIVVEEINRVSAAVSMIAYVCYATTFLMLFADDHQKERYLTRMAEGKLMSLCLTEPDAGSDSAAIKSRAIRSGDSYKIDGTKCFITQGAVVDYHFAFAVTGPGIGSKGISAFIVEKDFPGVSVGKGEKKMGMRGISASEIIFDGALVPAENRVGKEGHGFKVVMKAFDKIRPIIAAQALGIAQGAYEYALEYSKNRVAFGEPISQFQGIQFKLADMVTSIEAARGLVYRAAHLIDQGVEDVTLYASMAKYFASEIAMKVTTDAVQVLGGYGYIRDHPVERMMRDAKCTQIIEGTSEIQKMIISRRILVGG
ncbi:MAG: acyl-CoA dehydrogenase family protein [Thermodesulfobacteriota bacterium]|nr:acyl-CoA dehydrogenase family protein [Thermodesulfobacteriota bacterium]